MFTILIGVSLAADPALSPPVPEGNMPAQIMIENLQDRQEALQAINVDGLMALIEAHEANEAYAADICEPATAEDDPALADTSETSPLLVPVK